MKRIFRAAGIAAAAVAFVAAASSPSFAGNLEGTPDPGFTAHEVASVADSDLGVNGVEPPVETPQADSPNRFKSMFNHAWAWIASDREAAPAAATGPASKLSDLVETFSSESDPEGDQDCLANAVYFEARSEPIEGQLAVAEVVLNRAASGIYPSTECAVIKQHAQFSFIRKGEIPQADKSSTAWRTAVAIAHIAKERLVTELAPNILWYHADYVSPRWGRRLTRQTKIGLHIFYS